jgi:hypothetical protein
MPMPVSELQLSPTDIHELELFPNILDVAIIIK